MMIVHVTRTTTAVLDVADNATEAQIKEVYYKLDLDDFSEATVVVSGDVNTGFEEKFEFTE
jgi:hypothetical protein